MLFNYHANATFSRVHNDPNRFLFVRGPVGSGKSSGCIWHCFLNAINQEPDSQGVRRTKFGVIRSTYPVLKSTVVRSWLDWFKDQIKVVYDTPIRGMVKLEHPDGQTTIEMEIIFIALDREVEVIKLQSLELTACHINEAAEIPRAIHQMLKSRVNRFPHPNDGGATRPFILCDYNSVPSDHWLYTIAEEDKPDKHSFYTQPSALLMCEEAEGICQDIGGNWYKINPFADNLGHWEVLPRSALITDLNRKGSVTDGHGNWYRIDRFEAKENDVEVEVWIPHLDKDYYVDQIHGADPDWVNVLLLNNYGQIRSGRPVYPEYNDSIHASQKPIQPLLGVPLIIGMDLGLDPAAAFLQMSPTGQVLMIDEVTSEDCSIEKFCVDYLWPRIMNKYRKFDYHLVIDPTAINTRSQNDAKAAWKTIKDLQKAPFNIHLPYRSAKSNNLEDRKNAVITHLRRINGFLLCPDKCKVARKGFISDYMYEKKRAVQSAGFKDKPEKNYYSHIHDAIQYGCLELTSGRSSRTGKKFVARYTSPPTPAGY